MKMQKPQKLMIIIDENLFNPPQVQKVIVEHVIGNESTSLSSAPPKICTFSGHIPRPNGEIDYETWHSQADLLLSDISLNDAYKVIKTLESLLRPAVDIVKTIWTHLITKHLCSST